MLCYVMLCYDNMWDVANNNYRDYRIEQDFRSR